MKTIARLADSWGFTEDGEGTFRAPLPTTEAYPLADRRGLDESHPPYITANRHGGMVLVDIWDGRGWRAGIGTGLSASGYAEEKWVWPDGENLPGEWLHPVAEALDRIREQWPDARMLTSRADHEVWDAARHRGERECEERIRQEYLR